MAEYFTYFLLLLTSFFTLINPIGVMPIFMSMTSDLSEEERRRTATKAVIVSLFIILLFAFTGQVLFRFFGISVDSFRVAGGIIFFTVGYDMLNARLTKMKSTESEVKDYVEDISITPLAIPMICGPGAITNAIVQMEDANTIELKIVFILSVFVICAIILAILFGASKIIKFLGSTGNKVLMRIMGLIVMVIAVEFFFSGLIPMLKSSGLF